MISVRYIILLVALSLVVGCEPSPVSILEGEISVEERFDDDESGEADSGDDDSTTLLLDGINQSIASLKALSVSSLDRVTTLFSVTGQITANDLYGEFPDMLLLEDDSGAIVLSVDLEDELHTYAVGTTLTIYCVDLWLANSGGRVTLGQEPTSDAAVDPLSLSDLEHRLLYRGYDSDVRSPETITIGDISTSLVSCFVMLNGLTLVGREDGDFISFCEYDEDTGRRLSTSHTLRDSAGDDIELYIPSTVSYAEDEIPQGELTLCAILDSYYGNYSLRIVEGRIFSTP